jgi:hypothetical protein
MSARVVRIVLVFAMLFSTVGVSAASTLCKQKQKMASASCAKCKSAKPTKKSCCETVYKHLSVKSEYHRPATVSADAHSAIVLAVLAENVTLDASQAILSHPVTAGPPIALCSLDRCSLISTFRI